jgi:hypothetical protein
MWIHSAAYAVKLTVKQFARKSEPNAVFAFEAIDLKKGEARRDLGGIHLQSS